jgi:hypothetical protein
MPARRPCQPTITGDRARLGHPGQSEIGGIGQHRGERHARVIGRQTRMEVGEGCAKPSPAIHFGQQRGDTHVGQHRVEPIGEIFSFLRRRRLQRRDFQLLALDADVLELVRRCPRGDFGKPPF